MVLDIDLLRSFAVVADTRSFTVAGARLGATQSAVSVRLKKLEERLGRALLERTPRSVELTAFGAEFLADARRILAAHDDALRRALVGDVAVAVTVGISEHAGGLSLAPVLAEMRRTMPNLQLRVVLGLSEGLRAEFEAGRLDAAVIRRHPGGDGGRPLYRDDLCWFAAADFEWRAGSAVPLITLESPCNTRIAAMDALEAAGVPYYEAFLSRGVAAIQAATSAGLGISCLGGRHAPAGCRRLGIDDGMPDLPASEIAMFHRPRGRSTALALERLADTLAAGPPQGTPPISPLAVTGGP